MVQWVDDLGLVLWGLDARRKATRVEKGLCVLFDTLHRSSMLFPAPVGAALSKVSQLWAEPALGPQPGNPKPYTTLPEAFIGFPGIGARHSSVPVGLLHALRWLIKAEYI